MFKYLVVICILIAGCTSSLTETINTVTTNYNSINFDDGINEEEARIIAQKALVKKNMARLYDLADPKIFTDTDGLPNQEKYWLVSFKEKGSSHIEYVFMAVINKENGNVKFADDYQEDKRWILEAALLGG